MEVRGGPNITTLCNRVQAIETKIDILLATSEEHTGDLEVIKVELQSHTNSLHQLSKSFATRIAAQNKIIVVGSVIIVALLYWVTIWAS